MKTSIKLFIALALCLAFCFALISCNDEHVHSPSNPVIENEVAGSCTVDHTYDEVVYCSTCDEEISRTPHNEGKGQHNFVNGACTACNEPEPEPEPGEGLKFSLNSDKASYAVSGIGTCTDTDVVIPSSHNDLPVTSIGSGAFSSCTSFTSITIPDSVTSIGSGAFWSCRSLTSITMPDSVTSIGTNAFRDCTSLTSITIPDSVTSIGERAFELCRSLTSITIPDSVTSIGRYAFENCESLTIYCEATGEPSEWDSDWNYSNCPVVWDCNNNDVADDGYIYTVVDGIRYGIKEGVATVMRQPTSITEANIKSSIVYKSNTYSVTSIGGYAFWCCRSLTNINIPDSVTSIGEYAFYSCTSLTGITIPDSVTSIGRYAFENCESLTSITIPNSVTSIGNDAFYGCRSLNSITIPESVTSIGNSAFRGCTSLTEITVDSNNTVYKDIDGNLYTKDGKTLIKYAVRKVATSFTLPDSVTSIREYAFDGCKSLTSITIPDSVTSIGESAFFNCSSLTSITIPDSVTSIGEGAFEDCSSLTIYCEATSKPSVWDSDWNYSNCPVVWDCNNNDVADDGYIYTVVDGIRYGIKDGVATVMEQPTSITEANIKSSIVYKSNTYSVTSIGERAFEWCTSLTSITIPDSVTSIGEKAFLGCTSLTSITIPDSVTSIGDWAFGHCTSLTSITIPDSVTSIGEMAFLGCTSLMSVTIGNSVTSIGENAFYDCTSLTIYCEAISQPSGWNSSWNSSNCPVVWDCNNNDVADDGCIYTVVDGMRYGIKDGVATVMEQPTSITEANIKSSIVYKSSTYSVTSIGEYAFRDCTSLTSITIPDSVTSIARFAFYGCSSLTIYCEATSKPLGWSSWWNSSNRPVVWGYTGEE